MWPCMCRVRLEPAQRAAISWFCVQGLRAGPRHLLCTSVPRLPLQRAPRLQLERRSHTGFDLNVCVLATTAQMASVIAKELYESLPAPLLTHILSNTPKRGDQRNIWHA